MITAPIGGTKMPSRFSQARKKLQMPATARMPPITPSASVSLRIWLPARWLQPTAPLYRQCVHTDPRLTKTNMTARAERIRPCPVSSDRKLPPSLAGAAAAPAATTTTPNTCETRLATGNAVSAASTASLPERDQRVKSAVIVPLSAKVAITRVTAPAKPIPPGCPAN